MIYLSIYLQIDHRSSSASPAIVRGCAGSTIQGRSNPGKHVLGHTRSGLNLFRSIWIMNCGKWYFVRGLKILAQWTYQPPSPSVATALWGGTTGQRHSVLANHRRQAGGSRHPRPDPGRPVFSVLLSRRGVVAGRGRGSEKVRPRGRRGRRPLRLMLDQPHGGFLSRQKRGNCRRAKTVGTEKVSKPRLR